MPYITIDTLRVDYSPRELLQLSDRTSAGVADDVVLQRAIDRAAAMIDAELSRCYVLPVSPRLPLTTVPDHVLMTLSEWNGRIARYLLWDDQRGNGADPKADSEPTRRYKEVMDRLKCCDPSKDCGCDLFADLGLNPRAAAAAGGPVDSVLFGDAGSMFGRGEFTDGARSATTYGSVVEPDATPYAGLTGGERETVVQGTTWTREFDWLDAADVAVDMTGLSGTFELFAGAGTLLHVGVLEIFDAAGGKSRYTVSAAVTATLAVGEYWYRVRVSSASGAVTQLVAQRLQVSL